MTAVSPEQAARPIPWTGASGSVASCRACNKQSGPARTAASLLLGNVLEPDSRPDGRPTSRRSSMPACGRVSGMRRPQKLERPETVL